MTNKKLILDTVRDLVTNLLYYDRKEDEDLPPGVIDNEEAAGHITIDQMVQHFRETLTQGLDEEWCDHGP